MTSLSAISLSTVRKSFPGPNGTTVDAVRGIDLTVQQGEVVAFLGPNGAGKTTTIDMMLGLSRPTAGRVQVFGMGARDAVAHGLSAAVMQTGGLLPDLSVRDTVALTASLFVHSTGVDEALQRAGIADLAGRTVKKCSGGQQQRLRFAMALVSDPALRLTPVSISITDDGRGVSGSAGGNGLAGLRQRAEAFDAQVVSGPGDGGRGHRLLVARGAG